MWYYQNNSGQTVFTVWRYKYWSQSRSDRIPYGYNFSKLLKWNCWRLFEFWTWMRQYVFSWTNKSCILFGCIFTKSNQYYYEWLGTVTCSFDKYMIILTTNLHVFKHKKKLKWEIGIWMDKIWILASNINFIYIKLYMYQQEENIS